MPGNTVKNWKVYEALRAEGKSEESAARIANAQASRKARPQSKKSKKRRGKRPGGK
jgi:hypothetical protein